MRSIAIPVLFACLVPVIAHGDPASPSPAPAAAVEASPTPTTRLYVRTLPPGAQVMLDGTPLGPSDGLFLVPAGTAKVSVQFDGKDPQVRQVEIAEGRITRVEIQRDAAGQAVSGIGVIEGGGFGGTISDAFNHTRQLRSSRKLQAPPAPLTKFDEILEKPFDVELQETPLRDAARLIGEKAELNISFDRRALEDAGLDLETPVTASVSGAPLARGLDIVCRPMDLTWTVEDDGLQITTAERAAERLFVHVHDVSDLCEGDLSVLIELIQRSSEPQTWQVVGGQADIVPVDGDVPCLVIRQTTAGHRAVEAFLQSLK